MNLFIESQQERRMDIIRLGVFCILLSLCFTLGSTSGRITFRQTQNGKLEAVLPTEPPLDVLKNTNFTERVGDTPIGVRERKPAIPRGSEKFAFEVLFAISDPLQKYDANFVMSPFSIWSLMVLIAEGAHGRTFDQLKSVLHLPKDLKEFREGYTSLQRLLAVNTSALEVAVNQVLFSDTNRPLVDSYVRKLQHDYRADHLQVDFLAPDSAANAINNHINLRTNGKFSDIVTADELLRIHLVLASTIYFKGQWKFPFDVNRTSSEPFYAENGGFVANVPMMTEQHPFRIARIEALKATIIEMPYGQYGQESRFAMLLIQPFSSLNAVFDNLRQFDIAKIHDELKQSENEEEENSVVVTLPRFKIDSDLDLRTVFEFLGVTDVFNQANADLSKMSTQPIHVAHVFHKAIIEVDEVGTVAAAVTVAELNFRITAQEFRFNKPFGFLITDRVTNALLFGGQVRRPLV